MKIKQAIIEDGNGGNAGITIMGSKSDRCTIGYRRIGKMVQVAVSYCSPDDKWKAKIGQLLVRVALQDASNGNYTAIVFSIPNMKDWEDVDLQAWLQRTFFGFYV